MPVKNVDLEKLYEGRMAVKEKEAEKYRKKYGSLLESLEHSPLKSVRTITWHDHYALGKQLDQFCDFVSMCEDDGTVQQLGKLPLLALDLLSYTYGISPINAIASVQPIDDVQGMVMYRDLVAQDTRGNVAAQQTILSTLGLPQAFPKGYAGDTVYNELMTAGAGGTPVVSGGHNSDAGPYSYTTGGGTAFDMNPVYNQKFVVRGTFTVTRQPANAVLTFKMIADPDTGNFSQVLNPGSGNLVYVSGNVVFSSGTVTWSISEAPTSGTTIAFYADYVTLPEAMTDIQKVTLRLTQKPIWARLFTLKGTLGTAEAYQLKKRFGVNGEQMMVEDLTAAINMEIMNEAVGIIQANMPAIVLQDTTGATVWKRQPQQGVDYFSHKMTIMDTLADSNSLLMETAGRGSVNCHIAGNRVAAIMSTLPGWQGLFDDDSYGPHIYGKLNGIPVVRIPQNAILDKWTVLSIHKGKTPFDAPLVYAPYMPLVLTQLIPQAYNVFMQQQGAAVWAGLDPLVSNLTTQMVVDNSGFNYAAAPEEVSP